MSGHEKINDFINGRATIARPHLMDMLESWLGLSEQFHFDHFDSFLSDSNQVDLVVHAVGHEPQHVRWGEHPVRCRYVGRDSLATLPVSDPAARYRPEFRPGRLRQRIVAGRVDIVTDKAGITQLTIGDAAKRSAGSVPRPHLFEHRSTTG